MIVHGKTRLTHLLRPYLGTIIAVVLIVVGVDLLNNFVNLERPVFSMAALGLLTTALSILLAIQVRSHRVSGRAGHDAGLHYYRALGLRVEESV